MRIGIVRTAGSPCRCAESVCVALQDLGHESFIVDSREIDIRVQDLAGGCDLVVDHTDTYCGRGLYRPFVRLLLENFGARVLGSSALACFTADNKAAAKSLLADAGIPVPPGIVVCSNEWKLPDWLRPPLVLKPAFEHMSRGICTALTENETYEAAGRLWESLRQPLLVESYIPGRELSVSLIASSDGIQVLPVLEWKMSAGSEILTEDFKLMDPADERHGTFRAELSPDLEAELESLARRAFQTLNLRDYARFDIRLSTGGTPYFLEANTTPSLEPMEALAVSAEWAGLDYTALVDRLLLNARRRYESSCPEQTPPIHVHLVSGMVTLESGPRVAVPPPSTVDLANLLDVRPGESVLELGCGSGLLSIAAAKLGAGHVTATDLSPHAMRATRVNALRNGVGDRIEIRAGSWYEALERGSLAAKDHELFDVVIATPPQTPGRQPFGPKYGGKDGARHLRIIVRGAPHFLKPDGRLWILLISLANPRELWENLHRHFAEVALVRQTERPFTGSEYDSLEAGLLDYLVSLRSSGISEFREDKSGGFVFNNLFFRAARPRKP